MAVARCGTTSAGKASVFAVYAAQPKPAVARTASAERGPLITHGPDSRAAAIVSPKIDTASLRALGTGTPRRITTWVNRPPSMLPRSATMKGIMA